MQCTHPEEQAMFHITTRPRTTGYLSAVSLIAAMITAFTFAFAAVGTLTASPAHALCSGTNPANGSWHNIDPNTNSITRVDVQWGCADQVLCPVGGACYSPVGSIRVFGRCHPTDCDWGTRTTYAENDGWARARYDNSWATKHVWIKTYSYYGQTYLRVWVNTDFTPADGRQDYITDVWMLK
jgi:hypothetical protein